jgi:predicted nucleic acid-binding Zn ribbon protein
VARFSLLKRIRRRSVASEPTASSPLLRRAPSPGALRRERRVIVKAREERIRHLGGLTLEMYRRSNFRDELLTEQCREIVALEQRLHELDSMLDAVATARRAPATCDCGAPVPWGSHFCANCGRPVGSEAVVACQDCGHPLPADASFCASCGRAAEPAGEGEVEAASTPDETIVHAAAERGSDPWER